MVQTPASCCGGRPFARTPFGSWDKRKVEKETEGKGTAKGNGIGIGKERDHHKVTPGSIVQMGGAGKREMKTVSNYDICIEV